MIKKGLYLLAVIALVSSCKSDSKETLVFQYKEMIKHLGVEKGDLLIEKTIMGANELYSIHIRFSANTLNDVSTIIIRELTDFEVGLSFYRYGPWKAWTKPVRIEKLADMYADDNQFFLWKTKQGIYGAIVPLSGNGYRSTIGSQDNNLTVVSASGIEKETSRVPSAIIAFGTNPYELIEAAYRHTMKIMNKEENLRKNKEFPNPFEYLGYCTWDAMYDQMSEEILINAVGHFTRNNFPLRTLIIDDGWLDMQPDRKLKSFNPDKNKFPNGLKPMIDALKDKKGIQHVGIWHTINAYWQGIDPESELAAQYPLFKYIDMETWLLDSFELEEFVIADPRTEKGFSFFDDWYTYLSSEGVNFVKVDNQMVTERVAQGQVPIFEFAEIWHESLQRAVSKHFNGAVINCMDMTNDAFYNFSTSAIARTVEDYFPYKEGETYNLEKGNAAAHVLSACYNALYFGQMVYADYDMFQSHHPDAEYHAISRALSGGPIYVSDVPGQQNFDILRRLIISDGRILRSDAPLVPTEDCLFQVQEAGLLKTFSHTGNTGLLAIFHARDSEEESTSWKVNEITLFQKHPVDEPFVAWDFKEKKAFVTDLQSSHDLSLKRMGVKLYWIAPLMDGIAPLGLLDKYNGAASIKELKDEGSRVHFKVIDGGTFGIYASTKVYAITVNGQDHAFRYNDNLITMELPEGKESVIVITK